MIQDIYSISLLMYQYICLKSQYNIRYDIYSISLLMYHFICLKSLYNIYLKCHVSIFLLESQINIKYDIRYIYKVNFRIELLNNLIIQT